MSFKVGRVANISSILLYISNVMPVACALSSSIFRSASSDGADDPYDGEDVDHEDAEEPSDGDDEPNEEEPNEGKEDAVELSGSTEETYCGDGDVEGAEDNDEVDSGS